MLKQTEDQYPVAALWEQYGAVYNAKQGNLTSTEWYERFNTKVEVAESEDPTRDRIRDCVRATQYRGRTIKHAT